jgi:hypothetical protein
MARSSLPGTILETGQALFKEPFPPFADDLAWQFKSFTNFLILEALGCEKNNSGADNLEIR